MIGKSNIRTLHNISMDFSLDFRIFNNLKQRKKEIGKSQSPGEKYDGYAKKPTIVAVSRLTSEAP